MDRERILKINDLIKKIKDKNILKEIFPNNKITNDLNLILKIINIPNHD